jgi:hypothetical protein
MKRTTTREPGALPERRAAEDQPTEDQPTEDQPTEDQPGVTR